MPARMPACWSLHSIPALTPYHPLPLTCVQIQAGWSDGEYDLVVSTVAFGTPCCLHLWLPAPMVCRLHAALLCCVMHGPLVLCMVPFLPCCPQSLSNAHSFLAGMGIDKAAVRYGKGQADVGFT